jgi:o-succinylbenzoate synthase
MINIAIKYHELIFKRPAGTSRGILHAKPSSYIILKDTKSEEMVGLGECSLIPGLSTDDMIHFDTTLEDLSNNGPYTLEELQDMQNGEWLKPFPSIKFALESALIDYQHQEAGILFPGPFTKGDSAIPINGLIWMGDRGFMFDQIKEKIDQGWACIKIKIGAIDFQEELDLIRYIRKQFSAEDIVLRVDANGAFPYQNALEYLQKLSEFDLHSIEQPIQQGQVEEMSILCEKTPLAIALDEELLGIVSEKHKHELLKSIRPQYIILKPGLIGGLKSSEEWMALADSLGIQYWITSALEGNVGLNAIAQWTASKSLDGFQGLGTGMLFTNNIPSPLQVRSGYLHYHPEIDWEYDQISIL